MFDRDNVKGMLWGLVVDDAFGSPIQFSSKVDKLIECGDWSAYSSDDHVHNKLVADKLLRDAGFNVLVDRYGKLWFVDNGASFDFRACGKKKGWYWLRNDPSDAQTGYLSLARHPSQRVLHAILGTDPDAELMAAAKGCDFVAWAAKLPSDYQRPSLSAFVQKMACFLKSGETAENAG